MKKYLLIPLIAGALLLSGCGVDVPSDYVAVHMGSGPSEDKKPKGCVSAGTNDNSITNDDYFFYPNSERDYDATGQEGSDAKPFLSVTNDNVEMETPVVIRFTLDTDCKTLTQFHLKYARRYGVEFDPDKGTFNHQWITLLRKLMGDPADATLDRIIQRYNWRDVWNDPNTRVKIESEMTDKIDDLVNRQAKADYFDGVTILIKKPEPTNPQLKQAVANEQNSVARANAKKAQADADAATANARVAVAKAEAAERQAKIAGFGSVRAYLMAQCIQQGCNPFKPTYIVGSTKP